MLENDIVAVSPNSTDRVLSAAGLLQKRNRKKSKNGNGFRQPLDVHEHLHIDVSYINICGTFYYLCSILDGYSRYIVHWELGESMTEHNILELSCRGHEGNFLIKNRGPYRITDHNLLPRISRSIFELPGFF